MMYLKYSSYQHPDGDANVVITRSPLRNQGQQIWGFKERWHISGMLQADTPALLSAKIDQFEAAYTRDGGDITLFLDDDSVSSHQMLNARCRGGVRIVDGPSYQEGGGAEYSTFRSYSVVVEGDIADATVKYLAFSESLTGTGGGPLDTHIQPLQGLPVKQRVCEATPYFVSQDGRAIGQFTYPPVPGPLWPGSEIRPRRRIQLKNPERFGPPGKPEWYEFEVSWHYEFESAIPMTGVPNRWIG